MCGIAGFVDWTSSGQEGDSVAVARRMVEAQLHRGPDGYGVACCHETHRSGRGPIVAFGHTRLAILDLSERGAQPMRSRQSPTWITYNGEIYNFRALRAELEGHGRHFESDSDTEVLIQGYEQWGTDLLSRLRGMFALAIWDGARETLLLARDRLGIKPLYVFAAGRRLLFASEIRALLASGLVPRRLDRGAVSEYLAYQTVPAPRTLVEGVRMLEPGSVMTLDAASGHVSERRFWDLLDDADKDAVRATSAGAVVRVRELLSESASLHLVSDVPVGVFLSGGIDSSAVVALTRRAGVTPRTFSVVLPGSSHDEAPYARLIAERFQAEHTEIPLSVEDFRNQIPAALASVDHPSGDGLNTFVVSKAVRAAGIKVALSGLGGDEIFGGYPSFRRLRRLANYARAWRWSSPGVRSATAAVVRQMGSHSVASNKTAAVLETDGSLAQAFPVLRQLFGPSQRRALLLPDLLDEAPAADSYERLLSEASATHPDIEVMTMVSYAEARTYMHDVLLRDADQMSMAHGLEVRVPLLDHRLVEYVMGLPDAVKEPGTTPKRLLVRSLGNDLPSEIVDRPKQGFVLPFDTWMKKELRQFCEHHLGPEGLERRGLLQPTAVQSLWRSFLAGDLRTNWSRAWALVALNSWLEGNGISRS